MDSHHRSNDESSIAPVASLRSKFEQLRNLPAPRSRNDSQERKTGDFSSYPVLTPRPSFARDRTRTPTPTGSQVLSQQVIDLPPPPHRSIETHNDPIASDEPGPAGGGPLLHTAVPEPAPTKHVGNSKPAVPAKKPGLFARASELTRGGSWESKTAESAAPINNQSVEKERATLRDRVSSDASWVEKVTARGRLSSDASWVERIPVRRDTVDSTTELDSQESLLLTSPVARTGNVSDIFTRSARVGSDASWVESLASSPISVVEKPREYRQDLSARGSFLRNEALRHPNESPLPFRKGSPSPVRRLVPTRGSPSPVRRSGGQRSSPSPKRRPVSSRASSISPVRRQTVARNIALPIASNTSTDMEERPMTAVKKGLQPPIVPAPRRSMDRRRIPTVTDVEKIINTDLDSSDSGLHREVDNAPLTVFPDASSTNRRPPRFNKSPWQIPTGYDTRLIAVESGLVCTSGFITRVWDLETGRKLLDLPHNEALKVTAVALTVPESGDPQVWLGTCVGDLIHVNVRTGNNISTSPRAHRGREILRLFVQNSSLWSLDDSGELNVWPLRSLTQPLTTHRVQRTYSYSLACDGLLWMASGKEILVYRPGVPEDAYFKLTKDALSQPNVGDVSTGALLPSQPDRIYFGHTDGKITVYNRQTFEFIGLVHVSLSKVSALGGVGHYLWAGYGAGVITVYDASTSVWTIKKEWPAHDKQICGIAADVSTMKTTGVLRVVSLALDNNLKIWDGLHTSDWLDQRLHDEDSRYSTFNEIKISVLTWNAGACKPTHLQTAIADEDQMVEYLRQSSNSDILVFGFQELVDLEDKKLTAKSIFKSKKKDAYDQDHMTHQYRAWRDYLSRMLVQRKGDQFTLLHTASMVGLFTCVFVRAPLRDRIHHLHQAEVKRGMGGHLGNKGALVLRMTIDDSSVCFVNCHLAAGQTQTSSRNNDVSSILDATCFPAPMLDALEPSDVFDGGGDGSMILDHEICILNGDLNYRIDTMSRDTVIKHVQQGNMTRLLERDQLLLSRKKNPVFKLRVFDENDIRFAPTYKYNVNSDVYDTSEKRRSPAWCDRVLYRGVGRVTCDDYRRWEVKTSDHRPVSATFRCRVKKISISRKEKIMAECLQAFEVYRGQVQAQARS